MPGGERPPGPDYVGRYGVEDSIIQSAVSAHSSLRSIAFQRLDQHSPSDQPRQPCLYRLTVAPGHCQVPVGQPSGRPVPGAGVPEAPAGPGRGAAVSPGAQWRPGTRVWPCVRRPSCSRPASTGSARTSTGQGGRGARQSCGAVGAVQLTGELVLLAETGQAVKRRLLSFKLTALLCIGAAIHLYAGIILYDIGAV